MIILHGLAHTLREGSMHSRSVGVVLPRLLTPAFESIVCDVKGVVEAVLCYCTILRTIKRRLPAGTNLVLSLLPTCHIFGDNDLGFLSGYVLFVLRLDADGIVPLIPRS